ncbi:MAG TPA: DUF2795 domain-containing protein [Micavibrio sp.]
MIKNIENSSPSRTTAAPAHTPAQDIDDLAVMAPWLENIAFPKSREAILQVAEESTENDIEDNESIMARFREIPDVVYNSVEEVRQALGNTYENYGGVKPAPNKYS